MQRLRISGADLRFPGSPGIIDKNPGNVFLCVLFPSQAWELPQNIWGIPLIGKKCLPMLEHSLRLILTQGVQSDHSPPFRLAGFQDNWWQLIYLSESTRGGVGPLFIPSRTEILPSCVFLYYRIQLFPFFCLMEILYQSVQINLMVVHVLW